MESWKKISVSPKYEVNSDGNILNSVTGKQLKPVVQSNGYTHVTLCDENGHHQTSVHKIVATEFIPNPHGYSEINHIDGNKSNNRVDNLEWCDRRENMKHAYRTGLQKPNQSQITESLSKAVETLKRPIRDIETGECFSSIAECARSLNRTPGAVSAQLNGRSKTVSGRRYEFVDDRG